MYNTKLQIPTDIYNTKLQISTIDIQHKILNSSVV